MSRRGLFLLIYGVSGAAALIDEVAWTRLLTMAMGHTVAGASTVLAAFMGGMAAGAIAAGRYVSRADRGRTLRIYAALETLVGASALLLPVGLWAVRPLLALAYGDGAPGTLFGVVRLVVAMVLLLPATAAMGATLPFATRWMVERIDRAGADTGRLYAVNTVGATLGAMLAGFVLLPNLGLHLTLGIACLASVAAASGAWRLAKSEPAAEGAASAPGIARSADATQSPASGAPEQARTQPARRSGEKGRAAKARPTRDPRIQAVPAALRTPRLWIAAAAVGLSGFSSLALEVTWTRVLAMVIGPTTYAFSTMLSAFIGGLAIGAAAGSRLAARVRDPGTWLGIVLVAAALCPIAILPIVGRLPLTIAEMTSAPGVAFPGVLVKQSLMVGALLVPMTLALGMAFPLAVAAGARRLDTVGRDVAVIYAVNTVGAIAGSLSAGFLLIPLLGLHGAIVSAAVLLAAGALLPILGTAIARPRAIALAAAAAAAGMLAVRMPSWNPALVSAGAYKYAPYFAGLDLESALEAGQLLYYAEGSAATVSVRKVAGTVSLAIDGKIDASNGGDMLTQKLLAHVPLLLHPNPQEICIIGLGSGVTAGAALAHPVRRVDVLEISPEVVTASRWFDRENRNALTDPRTTLITGDGRSHLLLGSRAYDVIISEPSNPWISGMASMFTREFLQAARARLGTDGLLCQWAHTYDMQEADLRSLLSTFKAVFPHGALWLLGDGDLLFIGAARPLDDRLRALPARLGALRDVRTDLATVSVDDAAALLSLYLGDERLLQAFADESPVQTDDRLQIEFSGPRSIYGRSTSDHAVRLRALSESLGIPGWIAEMRRAAPAAWWRSRARMEMDAEAFNMAYEALMQATALGADDAGTLDELARASAATQHDAELLERLRSLRARQPHGVAVDIELSRVLAARGDIQEALDVVLKPPPPATVGADALEQAASIFADAQDADRLETIVADLQRIAPGRDATLYYAATAHLLRGQVTDAIDLAGRVVQTNPRHARAWGLLGVALATSGEMDSARKAFERSLEADPRSASAYNNLGLLDRQTGNLSAAASRFAEALLVEPDYAPAREGLADVLERQGFSERAGRLRQ